MNVILPKSRDSLAESSSNEVFALFACQESAPETDPASRFWCRAHSVIAARNAYGEVVPGHSTEIRVLWTFQNLYFLFVCPYLELNLRPNPQILSESNELWRWDVAEVFLGSDFRNIRRYREFEVSPQGEWVDLDIDLDIAQPESGWQWRSGCQAAARIDPSLRTWYGFLRIPYSAIDHRPAAAGNLLRINFFRCQGPGRDRKEVAWQPTYAETFHVPEAFGTLRLV